MEGIWLGIRRLFKTFRSNRIGNANIAADAPHLSSAASQLLGSAVEKEAARENFLGFIDPSVKTVLEIGPYYAPSFSGDSVKYFDVFSTEELRENAKLDPEASVDPDTIPEIHFHNGDGDMSCIPETFDIAFSSHCIEHQPNLVEHLNQVHDLLNPGGQYFIIAPDKRYCFDHLRPETSLGSVLQAADENRQRHTMQSIVDMAVLTTHNEPARHWAGDHVDPGWGEDQSERTRKVIDRIKSADGRYIDSHAWQFTPTRFLQILSTLRELEMIKLRPQRVWHTPINRLEFTAILSKD
ncbi:class I SAM-dependent methyltransferase [Sedimentitalea todarodis]|uniref:Class I SAM-dependent methyltransferase n=1 Tax=Sedimentitalea todarodis TaxID=1631240 RepID=A0ABU3VD43_9RHOB|nr:class I SAM-dependent methyltransferase [Sedimentitalea todarodis]MDU9004099.1 class I SAM-dependent methyltransferase [Sedimentitalea todarodis]